MLKETQLHGSFCRSHLLFQNAFHLHFAMFPNKTRHNLSHVGKYLCNGEKVASALRSSGVSSQSGHHTSHL